MSDNDKQAYIENMEAIKQLQFVRNELSDDKRLAKSLDIAIKGIERDINAMKLIDEAYNKGFDEGYVKGYADALLKNKENRS